MTDTTARHRRTALAVVLTATLAVTTAVTGAPRVAAAPSAVATASAAAPSAAGTSAVAHSASGPSAIARSAVAADPTVSPGTVLSADGRTATDGVRSLTVSQAAGLAAEGQTVQVAGRGYDVNKGVYVALCVIPPPNVLPTPCGGGVDTEGAAGASQWISSNPPSYGVGLARPYGPGGSFDVTFRIHPVISPTVDCRQVRCALLTRNDHSRSSDRSQDILVPVSFASATAPSGGAGAPPPPPSAPPTTAPAPSTSVAPTTTSTTTTPPAPDATVAADGRSVSDGTRTLRVERAEDLDPDGEVVVVTGEGFDAGRGVYVALCRTDGDGPAPGPCATGEGRSAWISSDPPEWGEGLAQPYEDGGTFEVELELDPAIDAGTECGGEGVECAVVVRADDTAPEDRSLDLALPVAFADPDDEVAAVTEERDDLDVAAAGEGSDASGGSLPRLPLSAGLLVLVAAGGVSLWWRRRGAGPAVASATATPPGAPTPPTGPPHDLEHPGWSR